MNYSVFMLTLLIAFLGVSALSGQTTGNLKPQDFGYYYILEGDIYDIRNGSKVQQKMLLDGDHVWLSEDEHSIMIGNSNEIRRFNLNGTLLRTFQRGNGYFSPDGTHKVFIKENDLWAVDLNWQNGQLENERQITMLGTFTSSLSFKYRHWYRNKIILPLSDNKNYILNTTDGSLDHPLEGDSWYYHEIAQSVSPDGRFLVGGDILNLETHQVNDFPKEEELQERYWLNDTVGLMFQRVPYLDGNRKRMRTLLMMCNLIDHSMRGVYSEKQDAYFIQTAQQRHQPSPLLSPDGKYFAAYKYGLNQYQGNLRFIDLVSGTRIETDYLVRNYSNTQPFAGKWLDNEHFLFIRDNDVSVQGTWLYDFSTHTAKKITSYLAQNIMVFPEANAALFLANQHLYRIDLEGNNLQKLTDNQLKKYGLQLGKFLSE